MKLRVLLPTHVEVDEEVDQVTAEGENGSFSLLPRHIDFLAALVPGLLSYVTAGKEQFLAVNGGTLVKCGDEVLVSTPRAVKGKNLAALRREIDESFKKLSEHEERARAAMYRIEADFVRRFIELEGYGA